jgi:hypothetical protein
VKIPNFNQGRVRTPLHPIFVAYQPTMEYFHPLLNRDFQKLNSILSYICFGLGQRLEQNPTYDERGLTDAMLHSIQQLFDQVKMARYYVHLQTNKPSEKKTGADILFRVNVHFPEVSFDRYVLLQAKKYLTNKHTFSETEPGNAHLTSQIAKMRAYSPEFSYLLLYATTENPTGNKVTYHPLYAENFWRIQPLLGEIFAPGKQFPVLSMEGNYPVTVLRASTWQSIRSNEPKSLLHYSSCFPDFILNDLITGKVGKDWDPKIESAQGQFSFVVTLAIGQG